jgi:hypothetical protein
MEIKQLAEKYNLNQDDFWKHKQSGKWIVKHDGVEKIASMEGIIFEDPYFIISERDCCVLRGTASIPIGDGKFKSEWTIGEADMKLNCKMGYPYAMAEKRLKDRLTLKLINAYEYGIYSDVEADVFSKGKNTPEKPSKFQINKLDALAKKLNKSVNIEGMDKKEVSRLIDELVTEESIFDAQTLSEGYAQAKGE